METDKLERLLQEYRSAPPEYQATSYWSSYEKRVIDAIRSTDFSDMRSGKYPILATFGFGDTIFTYHPNTSLLKRYLLKCIHRYITTKEAALPYRLTVASIQEMAYKHCELMAACTDSLPVDQLDVSTFGGPNGVFEVGAHKYTVQFLSYYIRYCFANKYMQFNGNEVVVELGSGSGYQVEVLKKLYPDITVLCFDLPAQIYLCEKYLRQALDGSKVVGACETLNWKDMSGLEQGGVYLFGNWKFQLLRELEYDVFWNAASFGEMEPGVVERYLGDILGNAKWIYLLQARNGKETSGRSHVTNPTTLGDYDRFLSGYVLESERDAWQAHRRLSDSGGYFEGVWRRAQRST